MPIPVGNDLSIYVLNVGQADTSLIRTPAGNVIVIDAVAPSKVRQLLTDLGLSPGEQIEELVITHPHRDHYSAANSLLHTYDVQSVSLAPFWHEKGWGSNQYKALVSTIDSDNIPVHFVSGYGRVYPDPFIHSGPGGTPTVRDDVPFLELLGPPNSLVKNLESQVGYGVNHLSIMARLTWQEFSMVFASDAQMENWAHFDSEGMLEARCQVLKAAHHGSKNGTQWERLFRLRPRLVVVSSEMAGNHHIPDVIGCAVLKEYHEYSNQHLACLTENTGSVEIRVRSDGSGNFDPYWYNDNKGDNVDLSGGDELRRDNSPTDWAAHLNHRLQNP